MYEHRIGEKVVKKAKASMCDCSYEALNFQTPPGTETTTTTTNSSAGNMEDYHLTDSRKPYLCDYPLSTPVQMCCCVCAVRTQVAIRLNPMERRRRG